MGVLYNMLKFDEKKAIHSEIYIKMMKASIFKCENLMS